MDAAEAKIIFKHKETIEIHQPKYETVRIWTKKNGHLCIYIPLILQDFMNFEIHNGHLICVSKDKTNYRMIDGRLEVLVV